MYKNISMEMVIGEARLFFQQWEGKEEGKTANRKAQTNNTAIYWKGKRRSRLKQANSIFKQLLKDDKWIIPYFPQYLYR